MRCVFIAQDGDWDGDRLGVADSLDVAKRICEEHAALGGKTIRRWSHVADSVNRTYGYIEDDQEMASYSIEQEDIRTR